MLMVVQNTGGSVATDPLLLRDAVKHLYRMNIAGLSGS